MRVAAICDGTIRVKDLPERVQRYSPHQVEEAAGKQNDEESVNGTAKEWNSLAEIEGRHVAKILAHTGENKQAAARILEVDRKTLDRMIKRHDISNADIATLRLVR